MSTTTAQAGAKHSVKTIVYSVAGYTIQMEFLLNDQLRWTYLNAPTSEEIGKTSVENADRFELRKGLILMAWTEKTGANVVDVFDYKNKKVYANFVMPDGKRYKSEATFEIKK
ncbi:hypothetical protein L4D76_00825 [Photobacterium sagamiensis]|uniref:MoaF-related domain-containing protein n=1 Tax=Photobacterium sagamiensis TaxID=2910241 RepID=UPI003D0AF996